MDLNFVTEEGGKEPSRGGAHLPSTSRRLSGRTWYQITAAFQDSHQVSDIHCNLYVSLVPFSRDPCAVPLLAGMFGRQTKEASPRLALLRSNDAFSVSPSDSASFASVSQ